MVAFTTDRMAQPSFEHILYLLSTSETSTSGANLALQGQRPEGPMLGQSAQS